MLGTCNEGLLAYLITSLVCFLQEELSIIVYNFKLFVLCERLEPFGNYKPKYDFFIL